MNHLANTASMKIHPTPSTLTSRCFRYVGRSPMENDVSVVSDHVVEPGYTLWTVGYILRLDAAKALLETEAHQHMTLLCRYGVQVFLIPSVRFCSFNPFWTYSFLSISGSPWMISSRSLWVVAWMANTMRGRWNGVVTSDPS